MNDSSTSCYEPIPKKPRFTNGYSQRSPNVCSQRSTYSFSQNHQNEALIQKIEAQKEVICNQALTILELQKEQYNYRGSNDEAEETITALAESQEELRSRNEDLEKTLAEVQSTSENQINHLKTESEAKDKQIQTLEQQLLSVMNTNKSNSDREKEIKVLQDRITEWQSTCDKFDQENNELKAEVELKIKNETSLQKEIDEFKELSENQKKLLDAKEKEFKAAVEERDKKFSNLQSQHVLKEIEISAFQENISKMEATKNGSMVTDQHLQEVQKLKDIHEKEMNDLKAKLELEVRNVRKNSESQIARLKTDVENLTKKISNEQSAALRLQNDNEDLNNKVTVSQSNATEFQSNNEDSTINVRGARAIITNEEEDVIQELRSDKRFLNLDEIKDGGKLSRELLLSNTVVKIAKLSYFSGYLNLYSNLESDEEAVKLRLSPNLKNIGFQLQINGEYEASTNEELSEVMPLIGSCKLIKLNLSHTSINYDDFIKLVSSKTVTTFIGGRVIKLQGVKTEYHDINEIIKELPNIEIFEFSRFTLSSDDCKKLVQLPAFQNLRSFTLRLSYAKFELKAFGEFIKKHKNAKFLFKYISMSAADKKKIASEEKKLRKILTPDCKVFVQYY